MALNVPDRSGARRILVTGATGTVGREVVRALRQHRNVAVEAAMRGGGAMPAEWAGFPEVRRVAFDFDDPASQDAAFERCDSLFLLRPPERNDAFADLIRRAGRAGVGHVVFLSVQGAGANPLIPHHRTERLLRSSGIAWTVLRPAYFMQNLAASLRAELVEHDRLFVPAGHARFALVDARDVGDVAGAVLAAADNRHHGRAYTLTTDRTLTFDEIAGQLTAGLGRPIRYVSPGLRRFYRVQRRRGLPRGFILVMALLHALPRVLPAACVTGTVAGLTGRQPRDLPQFIRDHAALLRRQPGDARP